MSPTPPSESALSSLPTVCAAPSTASVDFAEVAAVVFPSIPGYEVLAELGRGGMGVVYKARHIGLNRIVALKMILAGADASTESRERFLREAEVVARLQHPNVVQIHDMGSHQGHPFLALEYIDGPTLGEHCDHKPQQPRWAAEAVETLARAVHHVHEKGVIHRDLKPGNVMLAEGKTLKVMDFGLARQVEMDRAQTQTGAIVGTPNYMAPEQALGGSKAVGPTADVWALGAILYELLTGRPPFLAATTFDTLQQVVGADPVPVRRTQPGVSVDLETICLKCLQKQERKRYDSAAGLADDLRRYRDGRPILGRPTPVWERAWKWAKRRPAQATLAVLGACLLVVWAVLTQQLRSERDAKDEARQQAQDNADRASEERRKAERSATQMAHVQGVNDSEQGQSARGLLWLARSLALASQGEADDLEPGIRMNLTRCAAGVRQLRAVVAQEKYTHFVLFSPDGKTVLSLTEDGSGRLWDASSAQQIGAPLRHGVYIRLGAFSPNGKWVLTGGGNSALIHLWHVATGQPFGTPLKHKTQVLAAVFSPDSSSVTTADGTAIYRWDAATQQAIGTPAPLPGRIVDVVLSPNGTLAAAVVNDTTVRCWKVATGEEFGKPMTFARRVARPEFSPDGRLLVAGSDDFTARLWDVETGLVRANIRHRGEVTGVRFRRDGQAFLTRCVDHSIRLWDLSGRLVAQPMAHPTHVRSFTFSASGKLIATGCTDGNVRLWDGATGVLVGHPLPMRFEVNGMDLSPDGTKVFAGGGYFREGEVRIWDVSVPKPANRMVAHPGSIMKSAFSPDGKLFVTAGYANRREGGAAQLWDAVTLAKHGPLLEHRDTVRAAVFSPDSTMLVTAGDDKQIRRWDVASGQQIEPPREHARSWQGGAWSVAFSPDGRMIAAPGRTGVRRWEAATGRSLDPPGENQPGRDGLLVRSLIFSPDGRLILTSCDDGKARRWRADTGALVGPVLEHTESVLAVAFSPDGAMILTGSGDIQTTSKQGAARFWDATTGEPLGPPLPHDGPVWAVRFSPDGKRFATASGNKTARLFDTATREPIGLPLQHAAPLWTVAFSPDGRLVATGSDDKTARLWETATGKPVGDPLPHLADVMTVAFSSDGRTLLTGSLDDGARLWPVPTPMTGDPERIRLWAEVVTGMALDDEGQVRVLDAATWKGRRKLLKP